MISISKGNEIILDIDSAAFEGKGIGKIDGLAVFVPNTSAGDSVRAKITKKKKNYCEARLLEVLSAGPHRITPKCRHSSYCGGCSWQHVNYEHQLDFKRNQVSNHLQRIGNLRQISVHKTIPCDTPFYYRNKMEYSFGNRRWLTQEEVDSEDFISDTELSAGLHAPGRFDKIINIQECHLQHPISYQILDHIRDWCKENNITAYDSHKRNGYIRNVIIKKACYTDDLLVDIVTSKYDKQRVSELSKNLLKAFPDITTIVNNVNNKPSPTAPGRYQKIIFGPGIITEKIGKFSFNIDANSFFQTNTLQAEKLYEVARDFAEIKENDTVYDLYCGVGTLSIYLSKQAKQLIGIEQEDAAIKNAKENARLNNIGNISFIKGRMKDIFSNELLNKHNSPDCIITDPPRAGMHPDVIEQIMKTKAPKVVYISCNSSTMARDLKKLSEIYDVLEVQPVDMFPQTYHIETVAKLKLRI